MTGVKRWATDHEKCMSCGTVEFKHRAIGLCVSCYSAASETRHKSHITRRIGSLLPTPITKEDLEQKYQSGLSLTDIAREYNCTRQYVHKLLKRYSLAVRTQSEARNLALQQGKISYTSETLSPGTTITHKQRHVNESFFKTWTPAMAWVLGVIYTDGCLHASTQLRGQSKSAKSGKLRLREVVKLANGGNATALFNLAAMYERVSRVPQSFTQALKLYALATEGGDEAAAVAFDELAKKLNPVQIANARQLAQEWAPQEKRADTASWSLSIGQKEPELLEKVRAKMGSNALIRFSEKRGVAGALYNLRITNATVCADLRQLGLTPRKSLTLTFPPMPPHMVRHFVRGCWDGDGSIFFDENATYKSWASYISGSKDFMEQLVRHLVDLGLPNRTIHIRNPAQGKEHRSYSFRFSGRDCVFLYHVLYDNVEESMYLTRKHDRFKAIADHYEYQMNPAQYIAPIRPRVRSLSEQIARADVALRGGGLPKVPMQALGQQIKAANAAIKKKLEALTGTKPPARKAEGNLAPNFERAGVSEQDGQP